MTVRPSSIAALSVAATLVACGAQPRFALRPPVARVDDARPFAHTPRVREETRVSDAIDQLVFAPVSHALAVESPREAVDVNSLDEVPDSTWFTNRAPTPEQSALGACANVPPAAPPLAVESIKHAGTTPGLIVRDALGRRFVVKFDIFPDDRAETSTAADAIVSRLYWSIGFNVPCNEVRSFPDTAFVPMGAGAPDAIAIRSALAHGVHDVQRNVRVSTSLFVDGAPLGPWPGMGTRHDDPNDTIAHEDRRELRSERWLAAWVNHWDAREVNTLDSFVRDANGRGFVRHWFVDFSDALGGRTAQAERAARLGYGGMLGVQIGHARWRELQIDPSAPNLGYFESDHFDPEYWVPLFPVARFARNDDADLAWMARRIARITPEHIRAIVPSGRFTSPAVSARAIAVLLGRRARILRFAFDRASPLDDVHVADDRLCATDLVVTTGVGAPTNATWDAAWQRTRGRSDALAVRADTNGEVCVALPPHAAPDDAPDDAAARYATLTLARTERNHTTHFRAHFYDLGRRGYALVGVEH